MTDASLKEHWEKVYTKTETEKRGWYQKIPVISLELYELTGAHTGQKILDVGGGTSHLSEGINVQLNQLTILDISEAAISELQTELKDHSHHIHFLSGDICSVKFNDTFDIWHDRAVFHFLTEAEDRKQYIDQLNQYLKPGGWLILATFASDGPEKCSGLPVRRYSKESLSETLGKNFELKKTVYYTHHTPSGNEQKYIYCLFHKN